MIDMLLGSFHKLLAKDVVLHHIVFLLAGIVMSYNCICPYLAGCLLMMEVSTPFLNYFILFRNRLGCRHWSVKVSFTLLGLTFVPGRLVIMPYVVYEFGSAVLDTEASPLATVHRLGLGLACLCLFAAAVTQ